MTSRPMQLGVALAVCCCLFLPACHNRPSGVGNATTHNISITMDGTNTCTQSLDGGNYAAAPVTVNYGDTVSFQGPNAATAFTVAFPNANACGSPFQNGGCNTNFTNSAPTGVVVNNITFPYTSVTIGNPPKSCNNPGQLGLIMK